MGTQLFVPGNELNKVYFVYRGMLTLNTNFDSKVYKQKMIEVVKLPEGSFFGELPILLGITVYFGLRIDGRDEKSQGERIVRDQYEQGLMYELDKDAFLDVCRDYPEFKTDIYIRGEIRIAYFKHLTQLRKGEFGFNMKVLEVENQMKME